MFRGEYQREEIICVEYPDGDKTKCKVLGENLNGTKLVCEVLANYGSKQDYSVGAERAFKFGNNPDRMIYRYNSMPSECSGVKRFARKLSATLKRVLNPKMQAMYKAGFIDETLELTSEGKRELRALTYAKFEAELATRAEEVLAEMEEEKE